MGQEKNSEEGRQKGSHFSGEERRMLDYLWNGVGAIPKERNIALLARRFGKHRRTIERELKRGTITQTDYELRQYQTYSGYAAQKNADAAKANHGPAEKIGKDHKLAAAIAEMIKKNQYSPFAIVAKFEDEGWPGDTRICEKTVYRYVRKGMIADTADSDLLYRGKRRKMVSKPPKHSRSGALARSIDNRPESINNRSEAGHWEMDTVRGPKNGGLDCLLTLTERKLRTELIFKLPDGRAESVKAVMDGLERSLAENFPVVFKSVTPDNGSEFSDCEGLERSCLSDGLRFRLFYAHPYRACERGTNENANGIIRRFFPKGTDFSLISHDAVRQVQSWMNHYPRNILDGASPARAFAASFPALALSSSFPPGML
jgi:IS30 family transposase